MDKCVLGEQEQTGKLVAHLFLVQSIRKVQEQMPQFVRGRKTQPFDSCLFFPCVEQNYGILILHPGAQSQNKFRQLILKDPDAMSLKKPQNTRNRAVTAAPLVPQGIRCFRDICE